MTGPRPFKKKKDDRMHAHTYPLESDTESTIHIDSSSIVATVAMSPPSSALAVAYCTAPFRCLRWAPDCQPRP